MYMNQSTKTKYNQLLKSCWKAIRNYETTFITCRSDYIFIGGDLGTVIHDNDYSNETASEERNEPLYENLFLNGTNHLLL